MNDPRIRLVHCDSLSCEPILRRMPDGDLVCVSQCGDVTEPAPGNRVHVFRSTDNGDSWLDTGPILPETGEAVYCSEVMLLDGVVSAFVQIHTGRFLDMRCLTMQSRDSGRTWVDTGPTPLFPSYCFVRSMLPLANGEIVLPCQYFPVSEEENARLVSASRDIADYRKQRAMWDASIDFLGNDVIVSSDRGASFDRFAGPRIPIKGTTGRSWAWTEPTLAQLSDGTLVMLLRVDGSGHLWRSDSSDNGRTWSNAVMTGIPNPGNKPKLIPLPDGRIALINTPSPMDGGPLRPSPRSGLENRYPLSLWISDDDMRSFGDRRVISDFPAFYCYPDGFYEDGHVLFTIEINRHEILFFDYPI